MDEQRIRSLLRDAWRSLDDSVHPDAARQYYRSMFHNAQTTDEVRRATAELCAEAVLLGVRLPSGEQPDAFRPLFDAVRLDHRLVQVIAEEESNISSLSIR